MKLDTDLIGRLLFEIESGKSVFEILSSEDAAILGVSPEEARTLDDVEKLGRHLDLMQNEGLIEIESKTAGAIVVRGLTWKGHDRLNKLRNPDATQTETRPEILTLKPSFHGIGIDLKELMRRVRKYFTKK